MNKIKLLTYAVFGLLILNIGIIVFLSISRPNFERDNSHRKPKDIIIEKLHFNQNQIKKYESIIEIYRNKVDSLHHNTRVIKVQLYSLLKLPNLNSKKKDSLIQLVLLNQKKIEEVNFKHFQDIKSICNQTQIENFNLLTEELAQLFSNQNRKPRPEFRHPPEVRMGRNNPENKENSVFLPPPPPFDDHRPPPQDENHPVGPRKGNRPPPPYWDQERPDRPGDENRPPPPPREIDEK